MFMEREQNLVPESMPGEGEQTTPVDSAGLTVTTRTMELVVAGLLMLVASIVMYDSIRVGVGWAFDGPQAGYFPFYIGLILFAASAGTFAINLFSRTRRSFQFRDQSRRFCWWRRCLRQRSSISP